MKRSMTVRVRDGQGKVEYESARSSLRTWSQQIKWYTHEGEDFVLASDMANKDVTLTWDDGESEPIEPLQYTYDGEISQTTLLWRKVSELIAAVNELRK